MLIITEVCLCVYRFLYEHSFTTKYTMDFHTSFFNDDNLFYASVCMVTITSLRNGVGGNATSLDNF